VALAFGARASGTEPTLPSCALTSLDGDRRFDLEQLKGNVLWLDFWVSWCDTCAASLAFLNGLDREFRAQGLHVLGINLDEDPEDAREFLASHPVGFALATDPAEAARSASGAGHAPAYLIDRNGVIRHEHLGFQAGDAAKIRRW
jgi:peroxiredoxin